MGNCCCCCCCDDDGSGGSTTVVTTTTTPMATPTTSAVSVQPSCYYPNGMVYAPAMTCQSSGDSTCCGTADDDTDLVCMTNNLCKNVSDTSTKYERGGCTDPTWGTEKCLKVCDDSDDAANVFACSANTYCCESSAGPGDFCCHFSDPSNTFDLGAAEPAGDQISIATDYLPSATATNDHYGTSTAVFGSSTAITNSESTGFELGLGLGLGIPLGAAVVGGTVYYLRRRRNGNNNGQPPLPAAGGRLRRRNQAHGRRNGNNIEIPEVVQALPAQLAAQMPQQPQAPQRARTVSRGRERGGVVHYEAPPPPYE